METLMAGAAAGSWPAAFAIFGIAIGVAASIFAIAWMFSQMLRHG